MIISPREPFCAVAKCPTKVLGSPICGDHTRLLPAPLREELAAAIRRNIGAQVVVGLLVERLVDAIEANSAVKREGP